MRYTQCMMSFTTFVGVSAAINRAHLTYAALDTDCRLLAVGDGSAVDVLSFAAGQSAALVAISAPARSKAAAAVLTAHTQLPLDLSGETHPTPPSGSPAALRHCFSLVSQLTDMGYRPFPAEDAPRQWFETQSEAGFTALLGHEPLPSDTLEGRIQRQFVLEDLKLDVPNGMLFFEEVTRYRLLKGALPLKQIYAAGECSALAAAQMAWLADHEPEAVMRLGDAREGEIVLPVVTRRAEEVVPPFQKSLD